MPAGKDVGVFPPPSAIAAPLVAAGPPAWPSEIRVAPRPPHGIRSAFSRGLVSPADRAYDFAPRPSTRNEQQQHHDELSRYPIPRAHVPPLSMVAMFVADLRSWLTPPTPLHGDERSATLYGPDDRSALMAVCYLLTLPQLPSESASPGIPLDCSRAPTASPPSPTTAASASTACTSISPNASLSHMASAPVQSKPLKGPVKPVDRLDDVLSFHACHGPQLRHRPSFRQRLSSFGSRRSSMLKVPSIRSRRSSASSIEAKHPRPFSVANGLLAVCPIPAPQRLAHSMDEVRNTSTTSFLPRQRRKSHSGFCLSHDPSPNDDHMEVLSSPSDRTSSDLDPATSSASTVSLSTCSRVASQSPPITHVTTNSSSLPPYTTQTKAKVPALASPLPPSHKRWAQYWARTLTADHDPRRTVRSIFSVTPRRVVITAIRIELASTAELVVQLGRYEDQVVERMTQWERSARRSFQLYGHHHPGSEAYDLPLGCPRRPDIDPGVMDRQDEPVTAASEQERYHELCRLQASLRTKNSWGVNVDAEAETVRRFDWSPPAQAKAKASKAEMQVQYFATLPCAASPTSSTGPTVVHEASLEPAESGVVADADRELCIKLSLGRARGREGSSLSFPHKVPALQCCWAWIVPAFESSVIGPHTLRLGANDVDHAVPGFVGIEIDWTCLVPVGPDEEDIPTF